MQSEGPFSRVVETDGEAWVCVGQLIVNQFTEGEGLIVANNLCANLNAAYEERRKAAEKELEEKKAVKDALLCGAGFMKDGKRVAHGDVYLSEAEIKLKKVDKDLKELLEMVDEFRSSIWWNGGLKFVKDFEDSLDSWKKARGIE